MSLTLKHFDTRLNQWLHTDSNTDNYSSVLTEQLDNTLLEFFLPKSEFSFGQMDEYSTASDLQNHPNNHKLLFSSKSRLLYGEPESLEVIDKLCPDRKDRGAYGSIFLGACKNAVTEKLNILVVDDATGENGGVLDNADAWKLVGDCYGQISPHLYDKLTRRQESENFRVIQHRFGWRSGDGDDNQYRFGKGTLRPYSLEQLAYADPNNEPQIDLILPLSSFKGTDKDNPSGAIKPQIKPGLYNQTIWLGEKSQSQQGKTAISQLLASFPMGIKDFIEELEQQAQKLAEIQSDPRKVAQLYCETYEKRKAIAGAKNLSTAESDTISNLAEATDESLEHNLGDEDNIETSLDDLFMYKLIDADLHGHCQLLETEKVKLELNRFVQSQWRDIAIGRTLTFDRAMIIPSKELKNGEIYVPWMNNGEKILNFRSPFLNSNGLCVSVNKKVEDCVGPNGDPLKGIIIVNDEDHKRIAARIEALQADHKQVTEIGPAETESERQGRDFDGDCIGVALASAYPNLTAEAELRNLPENAYAATVKLKKQSFYREDGTQPEFEEIAIFMSDSISVGVINNQVTALEALESEIAILQTHGTFSQQSEYLDTVANHYQKLFAKENNEKNPKPIRPLYRERMQEIVSLASIQAKTPQLVEQALFINRSILRDLIEEGCCQNQIAVDMFKSARAPEMDIIKENKRYLFRDVNYIKDKKLATAYLNGGITTSGYSPVELLINQANQYFQASHLESRPIVQFADLFLGVEFTPQQKFAAILAKLEFDSKFNEATRLDKRRQTDSGPYASVKTVNGTSIEITNLTRYAHPQIWTAKTLNLKLEEIPQYQRRPDRPHQLLAVAQVDGELEDGLPKYRPLGTVNQPSASDRQLEVGMTSNSATVVKIEPELQESQIKLLFTQAQAIAKDFYSNIPPSQRLSAAAAAWSLAASRQDEIERTSANTTTKETNNSQKKVSNFIFAAFPNEIVSRLDELQFNHLKLTNLSPAVTSLQAKHEIEIKADVALDGISPQPSRSVFVKDGDGEYIKFGTLEPRTGKLPVGTKAQASVIPGQTYTAKATLTELGKPPVEFTIREIAKFSHAGQIFNGEQVTLTIANTQVPTDTALIKIDGKVLGELDSDSVSELKKVNCLENNKTLKLKLKSIGSTAEPGGFIIAESPLGNLLRLNKINYYDFKGQDFNDISHRNVTLELPPHKPKTAVFLDDKLLGVLHFNQDKSALKQLGILKNAGSTSFSCTLQSNFSHSSLIVDSATVQYPSTWVKEDVTNQNSQQLVVTEQEIAIQNSAPFLHKLKERATVLFSSHEDKMLGLAGLAVDNNKVASVQQWLVSKGIEFNLVPKLEAPEESRKGLTILYLHTNTIVPKDQLALKAKFGLPLNANGSNSPYSQYLKSLPNRPGWQNQETKVKIDPLSSSIHVAPQETTSISNSASASTSATNSIDAIASNASIATAKPNSLSPEGTSNASIATAKPNSLSPEGTSNASIATAKPNSLSPEGASDATLDRLRQWYVAAKELNRPQVYLDSISFAANEFKQGRDLPTEAISAMQADIDVYKRQLNTQSKLNQLSDRKLVELHHEVTDYLKNPPTQPPGQMEQQLVRDEVSLLAAKIDGLLKKQLLQVESVNSWQNKPFGTWTGQYKEAVADLEQIQTSLQRFSSKKEQKVYQLQLWARQSAAYQAWQNDPRTHQMKELSSVLDSHQMQARLKSIQQQEQQQIFERSHKHKSSAVSI